MGDLLVAKRARYALRVEPMSGLDFIPENTLGLYVGPAPEKVGAGKRLRVRVLSELEALASSNLESVEATHSVATEDWAKV